MREGTFCLCVMRCSLESKTDYHCIELIHAYDPLPKPVCLLQHLGESIVADSKGVKSFELTE